MKCINVGCTIYNLCKIKDAAHHCVIHKKLCFKYGNTFEKEAEWSVNSEQSKHETENNACNNNR